jgi:hypothetical protein
MTDLQGVEKNKTRGRREDSARIGTRDAFVHGHVDVSAKCFSFFRFVSSNASLFFHTMAQGIFRERKSILER